MQQIPSTGRSDLLGVTAWLGFIALFPLFVVYHYAVAASWVQPFAGGLFGGTALALSLAGAWALCSRVVSPRPETPALEYLFLLLIIFLSGWTLSAAGFVDETYASDAVKESLATLAIWIAVFFVGSNMPIENGGWQRTLVASAMAIIALFAYSMLASHSFSGPFILFGAGDPEGTTVSTYQGIGRSILTICIVIAAARKTVSGQLIVLATGAVALLALGSRAHLFATLVVLACLASLLALRSKKHRNGTVIALVILAGISYGLTETFLETRAAEVFDLSDSTSWQARLAAQREALQIIGESPLLGKFGYHLGDSDGYSHNALSAWAQYGLPGFASYVALMLYAFGISALRVAIRPAPSALWLAAFQLNLVALTLSMVAEPIQASVFPALGWGVTAAALREEFLRVRRHEVQPGELKVETPMKRRRGNHGVIEH